MKITIDLSRENAENLANFLLCKGDYAMTGALTDHIGKQIEAQLPKPVVTFKPGDVIRPKDDSAGLLYVVPASGESLRYVHPREPQKLRISTFLVQQATSELFELVE